MKRRNHMKKKIISCLLTLVMVLSMLPVSAFAASKVLALTVTADKASASVGETINYTVKVNAETANKIASIMFTLDIPDGLAYVEGSGKVDPNFAATAGADADYDYTEKERLITAATVQGFKDLTNLTMLTFSCTVKEGTVGAQTMNLKEVEVTNASYDPYPTEEYNITPATVTITKAPITSVTAKVDAPQKGKALDTTVDIGTATGYTSKVEWYKGNAATGSTVSGKAEANQVYTAKITLTASSGESFDAALDNTTTTEGYAVKKVSNTELLLTKTFDATADKDPLPGTVSITGTPKIGQPLTADTSALPTDAGTLTYKWYRVGTTESLITGETAKTYTPTKKDDVGKKIKVVVTAENYSGSQDATTTDAVVKAAYTGGTPSEKPTVLNVTDKQVTAGESTVLNCYGVTLATEATPPSSWTMSGIIGGLNPDTKYKLWGCIASDTVENSPATWVEFTTKKSDISDDAKGTLAGYTGVYDGNPHDAITGAAQTGYTVEYSTTDAASGFSGTMPKVTNVADSKTVWVKLSKTGHEDKVFEMTATVAAKSISGAVITYGTQKTYNGAEQSVVIDSVKVEGTALTSSDYAVDLTTSKATNVEEKTLKITGKGNYTGTTTAATAWSLVARDVTITPDAKSKTYGAADPELTYSTDLTAGSALETAFNTAKSGALSYTGTDVGAYIIGIGTLKAGNNFNLKLDTTAVFFTINQATPVITATTPRQLVNNGVEVDISDWASFTNTDSDAKLTYTLGSAPAGITLAGNKLKAASSVAAGATFEIKVNADGTHNFTAPTEFTIHVTVVNKKDAGVSITTPPTSKTYGDANFTVTATKTAPDGGTWKWTSTDDTVLKIVSGGDSATATVQVLKASATGATLTVTYTSDTHYGSASAAITVAQREVTISGITAANKEYDGSTIATPTGTAVINGKVGSDDVTVTAGTATFADKNVGTGKTVTFTGYSLSGADAGNYNLKAQPASVTANITAKVVKLTGGINATDRSYVKDNKTVDLTKGTLTFDGLVSGETLDVNIPTTGTISDAKVGTYNVTYSGVTLKDGTTGKASNYKLVSTLPTVTVNITKAPAPALSDIPVSQKYNVTTGEKAIGAVMPADAGTLTYTKGTESKTGSVTVTSWAVDATGKVTYTLSGGKVNDTVTLPVIIGSDNYADATVNVVITIIKATPTGEPAYTKITTSGKTLADAALTTTGSTLNPNAGTLVWVDNAGNVLPDTTAVAANTTYKWLFTPNDTNYESISGTIKLWSKSSGGSGSYYPAGITFTTDLPVGTINRVAVNGKTLDTKNYVVNGSDVTLLQSYLDTLKAGKYTVKIENKTHVSTGTFTIKADGTLSSPRTADAGVCLYAAMALMSGTGAAYVTLRRKKEN